MEKKLNCISLVDDDEPTNFINRIIIEKTNCTNHIQATESAEEALDYLRQQGEFSNRGDCPMPDLIFLDINMPRLNGWDFLDEYRSWDSTQKYHSVIVMLTTSLNPEDKARALQIEEVSGYESKPLSLNKMHDLLQRHFATNL